MLSLEIPVNAYRCASVCSPCVSCHQTEICDLGIGSEHQYGGSFLGKNFLPLFAQHFPFKRRCTLLGHRNHPRGYFIWVTLFGGYYVPFGPGIRIGAHPLQHHARCGAVHGEDVAPASPVAVGGTGRRKARKTNAQGINQTHSVQNQKYQSNITLGESIGGTKMDKQMMKLINTMKILRRPLQSNLQDTANYDLSFPGDWLLTCHNTLLI